MRFPERRDHYRCLACEHEWRGRGGPRVPEDRDGNPLPHLVEATALGCPACGHRWIKWLNWPELETKR